MKSLRRWALACGLAAILPVLAAEPAAIVTDIQGEASLDGVPRPMLLSEIRPGQALSLAAGARLSVMFVRSGREFVVEGPGEFRVEETRIVARTGGAPAERTTPWRASGRAMAEVAQTAAASVRMRSAAPAKAQPATTHRVDAEALARLEKRRPADTAPFGDRLMYGIALHEAGASEQARAWWARLARERADLPELEALAR